jgi:predicted nucleotidyltransferase
MRVIRRYARQVAEQFRPDTIILFGSYAYGTPHEDSDVDLLVVMPARNQIDQAVRIDCAIEAPFPLDLIVRTPKNLRWRLEAGDWFLREIVSKGKVLYEQADAGVGAESRSRLPGRRKAQPPGPPSHTARPPTTARRRPRSAATDCSARFVLNSTPDPVCLRSSITYTPSTMRTSRSAPEPSA